MSRLNFLGLTFEDLEKHEVLIDEITNLELPTEYDKLWAIKEAKEKGKLHKCKFCQNLTFEFNQKSYMINYYCKAKNNKKIPFEEIEKLIVCIDYKELIQTEVKDEKI